jgi:hypothetical protein
MATLRQVRGFWCDYRCIHTCDQELADARMWGRDRVQRIHHALKHWRQRSRLMVMESLLRCRFSDDAQPGSTTSHAASQERTVSLHNYGLAVNTDPPKNKHFGKPLAMAGTSRESD